MINYNSMNLHLLPHAIMHAFGIKTKRESDIPIPDSNKILFILVDGLRADLFKSNYKLTSVFPSTTAAALTSIKTGLTPREHGLIEWFIYCEKVKDVIASLPMIKRDTKEQVNLKRSDLFNGKVLFNDLLKQGLSYYRFLPREIVDTEYSKANKNRVGYVSFGDLVAQIEERMRKEDGLFYVYLPQIDTVEHIHGFSSKQNSYSVEFIKIWLKFLQRKLKGIKYTFVLTADHGQVERKKFINLSRLKVYKNIKYVTGSPRDLFLFVKKKRETYDYLKKKLKNYADVFYSEEILDLMGIGKINKKTRVRIGDISILPKDSVFIWDEKHFVGMHGGISKGEIEIPLLIKSLK